MLHFIGSGEVFTATGVFVADSNPATVIALEASSVCPGHSRAVHPLPMPRPTAAQIPNLVVSICLAHHQVVQPWLCIVPALCVHARQSVQ
ncbi:MAG: hypothetical protein HUU31_16170 [Anaerolineae bacterium]|nr:hypothetical protein [Anaerolineae bacterium]